LREDVDDIDTEVAHLEEENHSITTHSRTISLPNLGSHSLRRTLSAGTMEQVPESPQGTNSAGSAESMLATFSDMRSATEGSTAASASTGARFSVNLELRTPERSQERSEP